MTLRVVEQPMDRLADHGQIPIAFRVDRELQVSLDQGGLSGIRLIEVAVDPPWIKDYDTVDGHRPSEWPARFDMACWGLIAAHLDGRWVGGAVIAFDTAGLNMLDDRSDVAVLWDLRVHPGARSSGVGTALFDAVEDWARARSCEMLKVETQNINVPACRFYARMGCTLGAIHRYAYPDLPGEAQLLWYRTL
jgi:GNAT superfamily N-acetyltransferase